MSSIALEHRDVIVGVDTHKDQHVAAALDGLGGRLGDPLLIEATNEGYAQLLAWACCARSSARLGRGGVRLLWDGPGPLSSPAWPPTGRSLPSST